MKNLKKIIAKKLLPFFVKLNNFSYKTLTGIAITLNDGLHPKHRIMDYHKFFTDQLTASDTIIDIGCGNGALTFDVSKVAKHVFAIDFSKENIKIAKNNYNADNITYVVGDATTQNFTEKFDKIILSNVLEHIEDRIQFLKKISLLADSILLRVPMINRDWLSIYKKENGLEYRLDPTHFIEYTLPLLIDELDQAGWQIRDYSVQFGELWGTVIKK